MENLLEAQKKGIVLGLKGLSETGPIPRLDIDELLLFQPDAFNLFLLAVAELQNEKNTENIMSYYQIAGIHGLPRVFWNGIKHPNKEVQPGKEWEGQGYCAHSRPTFPTWHRPYLAMMEQTVYVKMAEITERYPESAKAKYRAALKDFRLPYWDYYKPRNKGAPKISSITGPIDYNFPMPKIFIVESVMIRRTSDDQLDPIPNPLNRFVYPKLGGFPEADWNQKRVQGVNRAQTVRYPLDATDNHGRPDEMNETLNTSREPMTISILDMIKDYNSYASFSTNSLTEGASGSLENIHNMYHLDIGGRNGHMSKTDVAAFDPVFWIHHCQIDRWLAIWQAAHPGKWFDGQFLEYVNRKPRKAPVAPLAVEDALPFSHINGSFWNGNLAKDTRELGYIYKDALGSAQEVKDNFEKLYSWGVRSRSGRHEYGTPPDAMVPLDVNEAQVFNYTGGSGATSIIRNGMAHIAAFEAPRIAMEAVVTVVPDSSIPVDTTPVPPGEASEVAFTNIPPSPQVEAAPIDVDNSKYNRDWYIDNVVERLALNGSFAIYYFIGKFNEQDVERYALQPAMAGRCYVFTSSSEMCDNCGNQAEAGHLITGTNPITPILLDYVQIGTIPDLTPASVVPFLIANLKWRIVPENGELANPRHVAGFKVGVSSKLSPLPGTPGGPLYEEYPQIVEKIIENATQPGST